MSNSKRIEVFRPGVFTPMAGDPIAFSASDLAAMAADYDYASAPAPVVVGHPKTDSPAYGWAKAFVWDEGAQKLFAEIGDLEPAFEQAVKAKRYAKISLSLFKPDAPNNPKPGSWHPKHIGFLGGAAPAVPGLAPVELAADDAHVVTLEFGEAAFRDVAALFRGLRDWLIEKHDIETADRVLPDWSIRWIAEAAHDEEKARGPFFAERPHTHNVPQETIMPQEQEAAFAEREAAIKAREEELARKADEIAERERKARHAAHVAFAEQLADEGRLLPAFVQKVAGALDALAEQPANGCVLEASFAEGDKTEKKPALDLVMEVLAGAPKIVSFGEAELPAAESGASDFAAPQGVEVDKDRLALLAKAEAYQKKHPGTTLAAAVKAVGGK